MTIKKYILSLALLTTVYTPAFSNHQSQLHKIILAETNTWFNNQGGAIPTTSEEKPTYGIKS